MVRPIKTSIAQTHISSIKQLENHPQPLDDGIYEIADGLPIHLRWVNRGSDTTFVTFSAAVTRTVPTVPVFSGAGTTAHLRSNILMISDPSLIMDIGFNLGWYAGNHLQPNFQQDLTRIIKIFAGNTRIVLFGASGGGFAALEQATRLPGADVIVANPQTDITKYGYVKRYIELAWENRYLLPSVPPVTTSVIPQYSQTVDARVIYIQNSGDGMHMDKHLAPFLESLHPTNSVHQVVRFLGEGHVAPDGPTFKKIFSLVCDTPKWETITTELDDLQMYSRLMPATT